MIDQSQLSKADRARSRLFKIAQSNPGSVPTILGAIKELADEALKATLDVAQREALTILRNKIDVIERSYERRLHEIATSIDKTIADKVAAVKPPKGDKGDMWSKQEVLDLIMSVMPEVKDGADAPPPNAEFLAPIVRDELLKLFTEDTMISRALEVKDKTFNDAVYGKVIDLIALEIGKMRKFSGGGASGDRVKAGEGVEITRDVLGRAIISIAGSGSVETPTGTVDSVNTSFVVTRTPKWIVSDGVQYFDGAGYSISGLNVTMDIAPSSFIRAVA